MSTAPETRTRAQIAMDEAIDLAIERRNPYPDRASFVNADSPFLTDAIAMAVDEGRAVVICYGDGTRRVLNSSDVAPTA